MAKSGMLEVDSDEENNGATGANPDAVSKVKTRASISILIESLVKNLCEVYEPDEAKAQQIYSLICGKLFEMNLIDESYDMVEFEGMRNQYQRALFHLVSGAVGGKQPVPLQPLWLNEITNDWSHYHREFDEEEYIAGGGFGQVFRVKHKLDGSEYAVKKIFIRSEGIRSVMNYLSEVKTFASLNHPNVVQYKAAWLELGASNSSSSPSDPQEYSSESSIENSPKIAHVDEYIYPQAVTELEINAPNCPCDDTTDFAVSFESTYKDHHLSLTSNTEERKNGRHRVKRNSVSEGGNAICRLEDIEKMQVNARSRPQWATLYIQMALCPFTLKQWLEKRNRSELIVDQSESALARIHYSQSEVHMETTLEIFKQLLQGIQYIHSKGIVHHDIKPSNIFIQVDNGRLIVQLGDFGLACPLQSAQHSLAFGTKLYAAPEQLLGKCDPKSDLYSIGIVLLELVETFGTDMERVHTITELRKGNIASHLQLQQPKIAKLIKQLVNRYPENRPDASAVLESITVKRDDSQLIRDLRGQLEKKEEEIKRLKELLKNSGVDPL